jgi:hypothetical protein
MTHPLVMAGLVRPSASCLAAPKDVDARHVWPGDSEEHLIFFGYKSAVQVLTLFSLCSIEHLMKDPSQALEARPDSAVLLL